AVAEDNPSLFPVASAGADDTGRSVLARTDADGLTFFDGFGAGQLEGAQHPVDFAGRAIRLGDVPEGGDAYRQEDRHDGDHYERPQKAEAAVGPPPLYRRHFAILPVHGEHPNEANLLETDGGGRKSLNCDLIHDFVAAWHHELVFGLLTCGEI